MAVTITDVARCAGVSKTTVSKFLNGGNVQSENRINIVRAIEKLHYRPNYIAQGLRKSRTFMVGFLVPTLNALYTSTIISKAETLLEQNGYGVFVCDCQGGKEQELKKLDFLCDRRPDGLVILPSFLQAADLARARDLSIPIVLLDKPVQGFAADAILLDNRAAAAGAIRYLLDQGHRRIAMLCGGRGVFTVDERRAGFDAAFAERGLTPDESLIRYDDFTMKPAYRSTLELMKSDSPPTALFATNYDTTLGAIMAINRLGLNIPEDLSVVGFDNILLSELIKPSLTMINQPMEDMAFSLVELLLRRMNGNYGGFPQTILLSAKLEIHKSVGPPRA